MSKSLQDQMFEAIQKNTSSTTIPIIAFSENCAKVAEIYALEQKIELLKQVYIGHTGRPIEGGMGVNHVTPATRVIEGFLIDLKDELKQLKDGTSTK